MGNEEIIIVYAKKEEKFAHLLSQLISSHTEHEVAEWEIKHWDSNKPTVPSSLKIIFLGSAGDAHHMGVEWRFNKFSMKFGWLGNRCVLAVGLISVGKAGAFRKHYQERSKYFKHIAETAKVGKGGLAVYASTLLGLATAPIFIAGGIVGGFLLDRAILKEYQYQLLICEFIFEGGFKKFVEE